MEHLTFKISTDYSVSPEDFHLGNEEVDPSFSSFVSTRIDLFKDNENIGYLIVSFLSKAQGASFPFVRFVWINPEFRGQKYSLNLYQKANEFCINNYAIPLHSDELVWVKWSARAIWEILVAKGMASKKANLYYCFN